MRSFAAAFAIALVAGAIFTPIIRKIALQFGVVSLPGGRHVHRCAIPRLGGVAMVAAFLIPLVGLFFVESVVADLVRAEVPRTCGLLLGACAMCALGATDDVRGVRPLHKLIFQVAVATLAYAAGFRVEAIAVPIFGSLSMGVFALPVTVLWVVGIVNAVNLIDGLDGLAAGVVFFAALTNFVVAVFAGATLVALIMAATMGCVLGFLAYNFNPARIFMGDSGSYFLGYVLAVTSLAGTPKATTAVGLLVPVLALGVPIFDVLLAMVRRILERRSIFSPDRGHIHHRLLDLGLTHRRAVLLIYGVCLVFAGSAIAVYFGRSWQVGAALLISAVAMFALVRFAGYVEYFRGGHLVAARRRGVDTERFRRALPSLPVALANAGSTAEIVTALEAFATATGLAEFAFVVPENEQVVVQWQAPADATSEESTVEARFPLGSGSARPVELRFVWSAESDKPSEQSELLLQIVADALDAHLSRVRSGVLDGAPATHTEPVAVPRGSELRTAEN
jgi:UDP-GlcNAc:undecaprenyl-phosphate GlcNAc-1-phosphate transferase